MNKPINKLMKQALALGMGALVIVVSGCDPVLPLTDLPEAKVVVKTRQSILDEEPPLADGQPRLRSSLGLALLLGEETEPGYWLDDEEVPPADEELGCFTLPAGSTARFRGELVELDPGGVRQLPSGPFGTRAACVRPSLFIEDTASQTFDDETTLPIEIDDGADTWTVAIRNPFHLRRLERTDDAPIVEGDAVAFQWSEPGEVPGFKAYHTSSGVTWGDFVRAERPGQPDVDVWATWSNQTLTLDLPPGLTGEVTFRINHHTYARQGSTETSGFSGPALALADTATECPVESCEVEIGVTLEPLVFTIAPAGS